MRRNLVSACFCVCAATAAMLLFAQPVVSADLSLFQRYFGTMEYSVTGTGGIRGTGTLDPVTSESLAAKDITLSYPANAEIVAAFLYWETFEKTASPSSARVYVSYPGSPDVRVPVLGKPLGTDHAAPCWSTGGSTGSSNGAPTLRVYRADMLRYLKTPGTNIITPKITVRIRDSGSSGNAVPLTEGASLVLVYRHPALSFKSIVVFDGSKTMNHQDDSMSLKIKGFDQATGGPARMTHIVGNGQLNFSEILSFNNAVLAAPDGINPFINGWDNKTFNVSLPTPGPGEVISEVTTTVTHGSGAFDCLSWGAVVFSTPVIDTDEDGLLNIWETSGFRDLNDPSIVRVNLPNMGADPLKKDLFVEIDYMEEKTISDQFGKKHDHHPKAKALRMVGDAFLKAGINVHFDIGDPLTLDGDTELNSYLTSTKMVISTGWKGGEKLNERWAAFFCPTQTGDHAGCVFPGQPGLISWRKGVQHIKKNYFSEDRDFLFHYGVFGHALAEKGNEIPGGWEARSISGRADLPGNTFVITLGKWKASIAGDLGGSAPLQASALIHELAHNLWGYHGRTTKEGPFAIEDLIAPEPDSNCNPNKQSSLNYLYQSAGLLDALGAYQVDLSGEALTGFPLTLDTQNENGLKELQGLKDDVAPIAYRLRWYAPLSNVKAHFKVKGKTTAPAFTEAKARCASGSPVANSGMIRVDGLGYLGDPVSVVAVDWNYDKSFTTLASFLDINFNGQADTTEKFNGFNDWKSIAGLHGLQQVGSGRNLFGLSLGVGFEDLLRVEDGALVGADLGEDDLGEDDLGEDDLGEDDLGEDDLGEDDLGEDDLGEDDLGEVSEIDEAMAIAIGGNGPTALKATPATGPLRIVLDWSPPAFGGAADRYFIYRRTGTDPFEEIGQSTTLIFEDTTTRSGVVYIYTVIGRFAEGGALSSMSNSVTVTQ